jgi:hypothetical protein
MFVCQSNVCHFIVLLSVTLLANKTLVIEEAHRVEEEREREREVHTFRERWFKEKRERNKDESERERDREKREAMKRE